MPRASNSNSDKKTNNQQDIIAAAAAAAALPELTPSLSNWVEVKEVTDQTFQFTSSLRDVLKLSHPLNLIASPFSLRLLGVILKLGSRGRTAEEIQKAFHFPKEDTILTTAYRHILAHFRKENVDSIFLTANQIFAPKTQIPVTRLNAQYLTQVEGNFGLKIEQLEFWKPAVAASAIDFWVEKCTEGKIQNLIQSSDLNANTRLVIISGVYFKGQWTVPFDPSETKKMSFYVHVKKSVGVNGMFTTSQFPYAFINDVDAHVVMLPVVGNHMGMLIYLPQSQTGLLQIEKNLKTLSLPMVVASLYVSSMIHLTLPRFKIQSTLKLIEPLKNLGMPTMFKPGMADFGVLSPDPLHVSQVVQKTILEVNERGCGVMEDEGISVPKFVKPKEQNKPVIIKVDRPFLFQIVDLMTNVVLISGCCRDPTVF